ncbi:hypothetical protein, partial [Pseudomonas sp. AH2 (2023)]|uniref:hypothetical protein n=1 Tax=Pseudomonas sp. AH2 (2023) TaxID=3048599 RepID=UPI002B23667A
MGRPSLDGAVDQAVARRDGGVGVEGGHAFDEAPIGGVQIHASSIGSLTTRAVERCLWPEIFDPLG